MVDFLQFLLSGITRGSIYGLVGVGFALIFRSSHAINFAQGEFVMIGGMATVFFLTLGLPLVLAAAGAVVAAALIGALLQRLAIAQAKNASVLTIIIITIGAGMMLRGAAEIVMGRNFHSYPAFSGELPVDLLGAKMQSQSLWVVAALVLVTIGIHFFFARTRLGKAVEATFSNRFAATVIGINVPRILIVCFMLSAAIGALGGVVMTPITLTHFELGVPLALKGFCAAIVGGLTSPFGAIIGGLILGLSEAFAGGYISPTYQEAVAFVIIIAMLIFRPQGLFGRRAVERV
ncbi:branched-chain amino acid ABC transporter permease [Xanthobacter tagetidis]|jgi:branched-chain amino acid transport system permease protein|uniref:Branched-chain amino acid ABC transporter permease n=1 Tax=Xanthobacter tagetidis TaxID=60216 RepID=A0A3L7AJ37_9HYPH|nr:branched-chain amino acid ABC transporter permease [Xanthobacter tagetidis]MBB6309102.1 branched-chain amino acid transport system permease protein [Xanthobacter tagetidis]RLP80409.1 branched-chain amino acid ABC transporter permease [Xanthobacter tagetidis]